MIGTSFEKSKNEIGSTVKYLGVYHDLGDTDPNKYTVRLGKERITKVKKIINQALASNKLRSED